MTNLDLNDKVPKLSSKVKLFGKRESSIIDRPDIKSHGRADVSKRHKIVIAVKQSNLDLLEELVNNISDPDSENFGKVKTRDEIVIMTNHGKASEHILAYIGVETIALLSKEAFSAMTAPISHLEHFLNTTFETFSQVVPDSGDPPLVFHRAEKYSLPVDIVRHVHGVFLAVEIPPAIMRKPKKDTSHSHSSNLRGEPTESTSQRGSNKKMHPLNNGYVTPSVLNSYYNIISNTGSAAVTQVVYAALGQTLSPSDLSAFQSTFNLPQQPIAASIGGFVSNSACSTNINDCAEANLDVQYIMAISQETPTTYYYWGTTSDMWLGFLLDLANRQGSSTNPLVISISYGGPESQFSSVYLHSFRIEALKLAAQGITIVAASGDDGVNCAAGLCSTSAQCGYYPLFPASSPLVTAVGATQGPESNSPEVACQSNTGGVITTGGGFSVFHPTPSWQQAAVAQYLNSTVGMSAASGFNSRGRGYPDVSLMGRNYKVVLNSQLYSLSGTSASAPVFAAMISLVNAARIAAGKGGLGWINPSLYKYNSQFANDVTGGNNRCVIGGSCCLSGFTAKSGWDPVTGWGSVNFDNFKNLMTRLGNQLDIPTLPPTQAPAPTVPQASVSSKPSVTAMPTTSNSGWMYKYTYAAKSCTGVVINVYSVPLGVCLHNYRVSGTSRYYSGYQVYSCNNGVPSVSYFFSAGCTYANGNFNMTVAYNSGCSYEASTEYYYSQTQSYSYSLQCSSALAYQATIPALGGAAYAVNTFFNDNSCSTTSAIQAFQQGVCANLADALNGFVSSGGFKSYKFSLPYIYLYQGINCIGPYSKYTISLGSCYYAFTYYTGTTVLTTSYTTYTTPTAAPVLQTAIPTYTTQPSTLMTPSVFPTTQPSALPTTLPSSILPSVAPSVSPNIEPSASAMPSFPPSSIVPSEEPSDPPTTQPSSAPTPSTTITPSADNIVSPTPQLTIPPSFIIPSQPSPAPTLLPSSITPSTEPSVLPTSLPSPAPTLLPSSIFPSTEPSVLPTSLPSPAPTLLPSSIFPSAEPSVLPTSLPSPAPTLLPSSITPSTEPSVLQTPQPSPAPTLLPSSLFPSAEPSVLQTPQPSLAPTLLPSSIFPSTEPSVLQTPQPSPARTLLPSSLFPSTEPSVLQTPQPSPAPTLLPSSLFPSTEPSVLPTPLTSPAPTLLPSSIFPSTEPSVLQTLQPSPAPTLLPSSLTPSTEPSVLQTLQPSLAPTLLPSSIFPSAEPSVLQTPQPSPAPTLLPSSIFPSTEPSVLPTPLPSPAPTLLPSSITPSTEPSVLQTPQPSPAPTLLPSSIFPSTEPS
eukprot:gene26330-34960_t